VNAVNGPSPAPFARPGPTPWGFIAFLFRGTLGLGLLNAGLFSYQALKVGAAPWNVLGRNPYMRMTTYGGAAMYYHSLPYVQIVLGLALVLGFMTTYAAVGTGLVLLFDSMIQSVMLVAVGLPGNQGMMGGLAANNVLMSGLATAVLLTAGLIWLSASGCNPWSLDALVFGRGGGGGGAVSATGGGSPGRGTTG
jgi:hypothetical protein